MDLSARRPTGWGLAVVREARPDIVLMDSGCRGSTASRRPGGSSPIPRWPAPG